MRRAPFHIAVSGSIGAGKSTLVSGLAPLLGAKPLRERYADNPYLDRFYREPADWAFQSFMFFYEQSLSDEAAVRRSATSAIQERVIEEHLQVFGEMFLSRGYLGQSDFALLSRLTATANSLMAPPDLLLYLEIEPTEALRRIAARARPAERGIDLGYLRELHDHYRTFLAGWSESPVLRLQAEEHDFRESGQLHELAQLIEGMLGVAPGA